MWSRRHSLLFAFVGLLALTFLFGCRAFQPEVVIVNKFPETFIMIAPAETSGGCFHFHTWWYGTDEDGYVDRFVWALTDTSLQDPVTVEDEEDENFNPAFDISTLDIGHWTTRRDTVFDFELHQGSVLLHHMTLHFVAVDDRGDFDRTPARLHFYSNALGNPAIDFTMKRGIADTAQFYSFADFDTIAFLMPFTLRWNGSTPNAYDDGFLAARDTVGEHVDNPDVEPDGLQGFKFQFGGGVDGCSSSEEDCWRPRFYSEVSGDSVSYFGRVTELEFANEIQGEGVDIYRRRIDFDILEVRVNAIDIAGVEVPRKDQLINVVVNYNPVTRILVGEPDPYFDDDAVYPYYRVAGSDEQFSFLPGDTIPDRAYVVVKAVGRDDQRDIKLDLFDWDVLFQGVLNHHGMYQDIGYIDFPTGYSELGCRWPAEEPGEWSSDTLGFYVGPFDYDVDMRSADEHMRRGETDVLSFYANYGPCVQCIEMLRANEMSTYDVSSSCWDASCIAEPDTLWAYHSSLSPGPEYHTALRVDNTGRDFWINSITGEVLREEPLDSVGFQDLSSAYFEFRFLLHGKDGHPHEYPAVGDETERIMAWNYEVNYDTDPRNLIQDGAGNDDIRFSTDLFSSSDPNSSIYIDNDGTWYLTIGWMVPEMLVALGPINFRAYLGDIFPNLDTEDLFIETTKQLGAGSIEVRARDQASCDSRSDWGKYHYFSHVRTPTDSHGYVCSDSYEDEMDRKSLEDFARVSESYTKQFVLRVLFADGSHYPPD